MTAKPTKKPSGSVNVSLRLDPKTKFLIDLISRSHKRTITGVIEWAIERMSRLESERGQGKDGLSLGQIADYCWSTEEPSRILQLNEIAPSLLTYEEQRIIDTIKNTRGLLDPKGNIDAELVRFNWETIKTQAETHANKPVAPGIHSNDIIPF